MKKIAGSDNPVPGTRTEVVFKLEPGDRFRRLVWEYLNDLEATERAKERQLIEEARAWAKSTLHTRSGSRKLLGQIKGSMLLLGDYDRLAEWCRARLAKAPNAEWLGQLPQSFFKSRTRK